VRTLPHNYQFPALRFNDTGNRLFRLNALSRYKDFEVLEYNGDQTIESWYPVEFDEESTDRVYQITALEERRPDLLCSSIYSSTDLIWWIIAMQERMIDPFLEIIPGLMVRTPSATRVFTRLTS